MEHAEEIQAEISGIMEDNDISVSEIGMQYPHKSVKLLDGPPYCCSKCHRTFSKKEYLRRHMKTSHGCQDLVVHRKSVVCPGCSQSFTLLKDLTTHITNSHNVQPETTELTFYSEEEFAKWKADEEWKTTSFFASKRKSVVDAAVTVQYFACNRSGPHISIAERRKTKVDNSIKTGYRCPATMKKTIITRDGQTEITVSYQGVHFGHEMDPGRLRWSQCHQDVIAGSTCPVQQQFDPMKQISVATTIAVSNVDASCGTDAVNEMNHVSIQAIVTDLQNELGDPILLNLPLDTVCSEYPVLTEDTERCKEIQAGISHIMEGNHSPTMEMLYHQENVDLLDGPRYSCPKCYRTLSKKANLKQHMQKKHGIEDLVVYSRSLVCPGCSESFISQKELTTHITSTHNVQLETTKLTFCSEEEFAKWKADEELKTTSFFAKKRTNIVDDTVRVQYFGCNRSGTHVSRAKRRKKKFLTSIKTGNTCPATITKKCVTRDGVTEITVSYQSVHFGHLLEPTKRLPPLKSDQDGVVGKPISGVTEMFIVQNVRRQRDPTKLVSILAREAVCNVAASCGTKNIVRQIDDVSAQAIVMEVQKEHDDRSLPNEPQDSVSFEYPLLTEANMEHLNGIQADISDIVEDNDSSMSTEMQDPHKNIDLLDGPPYTCPKCDGTFSKKPNFRRHMKKNHGCQDFVVYRRSLLCPGCSQSFLSQKDLTTHITSAHDVRLETTQLTFSSEGDFVKWKEEEELRTTSFFATRRTNIVDDTMKVQYYGCNRSGPHLLKPERPQTKLRNSIKTGITCPATIKKMSITHDGQTEITVSYQSVHFGHQMDPGRLRLSKWRNGNAAGKLCSGATKMLLLKGNRRRKTKRNVAASCGTTVARHQEDHGYTQAISDADMEQSDGIQVGEEFHVENIDLLDGPPYCCPKCSKAFSKRANLKRHVQHKHGGQDTAMFIRSLVCPGCSESFISQKELTTHITSTHNVQLETTELAFFSEEEFVKWKADEELKTTSFFAIKRTNVVDDAVKVQYFSCNRSGPHVSKAKRRKKFMNSIKTGNACPATIKKKCVTRDGTTEITVSYQSVHFGHQMDPETLPSSKSHQDNVAEKPSSSVTKVPIPKVGWQKPDPTKRVAILNRNVANNVAAPCGTNVVHQPRNILPAQTIVSEVPKEQGDPILLIKPPDTVSSEYPVLSDEI